MLLVCVAGVSQKARKENEPLLPDILFIPGALFCSTACQLACSIFSTRKRIGKETGVTQANFVCFVLLCCGAVVFCAVPASNTEEGIGLFTFSLRNYCMFFPCVLSVEKYTRRIPMEHYCQSTHNIQSLKKFAKTL